MRAIDATHLGLMCAAAALAYLVPFELLLLAYVVLGPAHYLTEISWLHDRKYFLPHPGIALALTATAIGAAFIENGVLFGVVIWTALVACVLFAAATTMAQSMAVLAAATVATIILASGNNTFIVLGTLVPTLVHVSLFTLVFMTLGALRARSKAQGVLIVIYVAIVAAIVVLPPSNRTLVPLFAQVARDYFGGVAPALGRVFGITDLALDGRVTGLLAFVYSYHYLNWFIKTEVIGWANAPKPRLAGLAVASAASTALYFYDYAIGFTVLLALSLVHVLLEFPLNSLSVRQLGSLAGQAVMWRAKPKRRLPQ